MRALDSVEVVVGVKVSVYWLVQIVNPSLIHSRDQQHTANGAFDFVLRDAAETKAKKIHVGENNVPIIFVLPRSHAVAVALSGDVLLGFHVMLTGEGDVVVAAAAAAEVAALYVEAEVPIAGCVYAAGLDTAVTPLSPSKFQDNLLS